jgi:hypothetical protein
MGGGNCNGTAWCAAVRLIDSFDCDNCNHNNSDNQCDVINGIEPINNETCECIANELRTRAIEDEFGHLPLDIDDYLTKQYNSYYEPED